MPEIDERPAWSVEATGLTRSYGNRLALRKVDFKAKHGDRVAVFGPNGAGKTTLIKTLATVLKPGAGRITIEKMDAWAHTGEVRRRIGLVSHNTFLYGHLTVYENLDFYARIYDVAQRSERIRELVEKVEMTARLYDRVDSLSRGMQQRISIARALLHHPSVLLLDEPETGLDQRFSSIMWPVLLDEGTDSRTVLFTTHSLERGFDMCNRIIILAKGKIVHDCMKTEVDAGLLKDLYHSMTGDLE